MRLQSSHRCPARWLKGFLQPVFLSISPPFAQKQISSVKKRHGKATLSTLPEAPMYHHRPGPQVRGRWPAGDVMCMPSSAAACTRTQPRKLPPLVAAVRAVRLVCVLTTGRASTGLAGDRMAGSQGRPTRAAHTDDVQNHKQSCCCRPQWHRQVLYSALPARATPGPCRSSCPRLTVLANHFETVYSCACRLGRVRCLVSGAMLASPHASRRQAAQTSKAKEHASLYAGQGYLNVSHAAAVAVKSNVSSTQSAASTSVHPDEDEVGHYQVQIGPHACLLLVPFRLCFPALLVPFRLCFHARLRPLGVRNCAQVRRLTNRSPFRAGAMW